MFDKISVTLYSLDTIVLLREWREPADAKLWMFNLRPQDHPSIKNDLKYGPVTLNDHKLPSIGDLACYLHMEAGFPVNPNRITDIKAGNFTFWTGITYDNASKYCPVSVESLQVHLTKSIEGVCSTKPRSPSDTKLPAVKSQELLIQVDPIRNLYTDDMGRFSVFSCIGNQYIMLAFYINTNAILVELF